MLTVGWLIIAIVLAITDMLLGTIYFLIIALASLCAFIAALLGLDLTWQLAAFSIFGVVGCVLFSLRKTQQAQKSKSAADLQSIDKGNFVEVHHWDKNGRTQVFYRGTRWEAQAEHGQKLEPGQWKIVGMNANTLILARN